MKTFDVFAQTAKWARARDLEVFAFEETTSTNLLAKNEIQIGLPDALYLARVQTAGRGRSSNSWESTPGALLSSWSFALRQAPQPILAPLAGLALYQAAKEAWPEIPFSLKAPNDLYIGRLKVAGLLIETVVTGEKIRTVIGLGLNVMTTPKNVPAATALADHSEITESLWQSFLTSWLKNLSGALKAGVEREMPEAQTLLLCAALNQNPLLPEPILAVDRIGQLRSRSRTWFWHEL